VVDLDNLFRWLQANGLVINQEKCKFGQKKLNLLGHEVSAAGTRPLQDNVAALLSFPLPHTIKQLQVLLGLVNFYRRFIPAAAVLRPLTDCLRSGRAGAEKLQWSEPMLQAVSKAKAAVASTLAHPTIGAELSLAVDASADHVGAALQQRSSAAAAWQPLGFFSKKLDPAQAKYTAFDRELYASYAGIRHFRCMLEGRRFTIYTDHKPLTYALFRTSDPWTARQCRQLSYVAEFTSDIQHIKAEESVVADTLSRPPPPPSQTSDVAASPLATVASASGQPLGQPKLDFATIAERQQQCPSIYQLITSSSLQVKYLPLGDKLLLCDFSTGAARPLIPAADRRGIFDLIHGLAHP
jgi:cleavage and polyadenylation specificity factor subunit 1